MITLITGLPGNGKTLFALWFVKKYAESENREVFYSGVSDLQLPWTMIEPENWVDLPSGAIVVIDEAQNVFPKKPNGAKLPDFYEKLATHRHKGLDIFLITQHPSLVDNFARQLVGRHFHAVRKFGMSRATIYEWSAANASPQSQSSQKSAIPLKWGYPKEVYGYYKSAEMHTVKRSIPAKLVLAVLFVVGMAAVCYWALDRYQGRTKKPVVDAGVSAGASGQVSGLVSSAPAALDPVADARRYVHETTPRVQGLAHTAPKYDELTKPVRVPVPAACVKVGSLTSSKGVRCRCYTQQGTPMQVDMTMCLDIAQNGFFQEFDPEPNQSRPAPVAQAAAVPASYDPPAGSNVVVIPDTSSVPLRSARKG